MESLPVTLARIEKKLDASVRINELQGDFVSTLVTSLAIKAAGHDPEDIAQGLIGCSLKLQKATKDYNNIK